MPFEGGSRGFRSITIVPIALLMLLSGLAPSCAEQTNISPEASALLAPQVEGIRAAAAEGDRDSASRHLNRLQINVAEMIRTGKLSQDSARAILDAAAEVESNLDLIPSRSGPVRAEPEATSSPSPSFPAQRDQEDDAGKDARGEDDDDDGGGGGDRRNRGSQGKENKDEDD
jgi:hypothetical protein